MPDCSRNKEKSNMETLHLLYYTQEETHHIDASHNDSKTQIMQKKKKKRPDFHLTKKGER